MRLLPILMLLAGVAQAGEMTALCPEGKQVLELLNKPDGKVSAKVPCPARVLAYRSEGEWTKVQAGPRSSIIDGYIATKLLTENPAPIAAMPQEPRQNEVSSSANAVPINCAVAPADPKVRICTPGSQDLSSLGKGIQEREQMDGRRAVEYKEASDRAEIEKIKAANPPPVINVEVGVTQRNTTVVPIIVNGR